MIMIDKLVLKLNTSHNIFCSVLFIILISMNNKINSLVFCVFLCFEATISNEVKLKTIW